MKSTNDVTANKAIVLFDGICPLCRKSVGLVKRLDWLGRLTYQDARDVEHLPKSSVPLDSDRLLREMHLLTPNRKHVYSGFKAVRWMAGRMPLLWPLWPILYVPGMPVLGQRIYLWIAKNRYHLVPCHDGACTVSMKSQTATAVAHSNNGVQTPVA